MEKNETKDIKSLIKKYDIKNVQPIKRAKSLKKIFEIFGIIIVFFTIIYSLQILPGTEILFLKIIIVINAGIIVFGVIYILHKSSEILSFFEELEKDYKKYKELFD
jgi:hypothetical protein